VKPIYVHGVGIWTPGYDRPLAWCEQEADPNVLKPTAALLEGNLRRRATPLSRMGVEVFDQAVTHAKRDPASIQTVWATAHGEHTPAIKLLEMMQLGEGKLSPTQFHNSVHNTSGGYASIATGNVAASTTLTGGRELVASALLEAWCLAEFSGHDVALILADEALLSPFERPGACVPLALSLLLSEQPEGSLCVLENLRRDRVSPVQTYERFGELYISSALPLLEHVVDGRSGNVSLQLAGDDSPLVWCVDLKSTRT